MSVRLLGIVGASGSGKTTLIERLLPLLRAEGLCVATIKHAHHPIEPDALGKDSWRHRKAGAAASLLVGPNAMQLVGDAPDCATPEALAQRWLDGADLVLVEGFHAWPGPKLEVVRAGWPRREGLCGRLAVVSDKPAAFDVPVLDWNDPESVAAFVMRWWRDADS